MPAVAHVNRLKPVYSAASVLHYGWRFVGRPTALPHQGASTSTPRGSYSPAAHRLTIRVDKQSNDSKGVRDWILQNLQRVGAANPATAIYVQPVRNTVPSLRAEYANGRQLHVSLKNATPTDVMRDVTMLLSRSGDPILHYDFPQQTRRPSIQGHWTPVFAVRPKVAAADDQLPAPHLGTARRARISATEYILQNSLPPPPAEANQ